MREEIKDLMEFTDERVYMMMAITRQKENEDITANTRRIHRSVIREEDEIEDTIEHLRRITNDSDKEYRLYLSVNGRNVIDATFRLRQKLDEKLKMAVQGNKEVIKTFKKTDSEFKSVLQEPECRDERRFMFDLDNTEEGHVDVFINRISKHDGSNPEVKLAKSSPNGHHIVTERFHYTSEFDFEVEKKKDDMLYIGML